MEKPKSGVAGMDPYLLAWAARVKARHALGGHLCVGHRGSIPPLWLFTDANRRPDPLPIVARLPRGMCGVVLRHDHSLGRERLAVALARLCRDRRLLLAVAGDWRLAARIGAGLHLRAGRRPATVPRRMLLLTASAHRPSDVTRAKRAGVTLVFISPIFPTPSHPGARALGISGWCRLAHLAPERAAALGGITGDVARRIPFLCRALGGIEAFES